MPNETTTADQVDELLSGVHREPARPRLAIWQTEPCPAWCYCASGGSHPDNEHPDDRTHYGADEHIPLRLIQAVDLGNGECDLSELRLYLGQPSRAGLPSVRFLLNDQPMGREAGTGRRGRDELDLSIDEAELLAAALAKMVTIARS